MTDRKSLAGSSLLSIFPQIYIINLPQRSDRRIEIETQLTRIGLAPQGEQITVFPAIRPDDAGPFPSSGARGCFLSHMRVLELISRGSAPSALILEDDADFVFDFADRIEEVAQALATRKWDIVYGGHALPPPAGDDFPWQTVAPETPVSLAHCIGVRREVAAQMREYLSQMLNRPAGSSEGGPMHVDGAYSWFRRAHPKLITVALHPPIATQRPSPTDIHARRWFDRIATLRPALRILRRLKRRGWRH